MFDVFGFLFYFWFGLFCAICVFAVWLGFALWLNVLFADLLVVFFWITFVWVFVCLFCFVVVVLVSNLAFVGWILVVFYVLLW